MLCQEKFYEIYKKEAEHIAFCPYRICPIGAHSDHNLGKITGIAIDKGIHIAYRAIWQETLLPNIYTHSAQSSSRCMADYTFCNEALPQS